MGIVWDGLLHDVFLDKSTIFNTFAKLLEKLFYKKKK